MALYYTQKLKPNTTSYNYVHYSYDPFDIG